MTPSAPRPTTAPGKVSRSSLRESFTTSPEAVTNSSAETAVARLPFFSPEPWVAVRTGSGDGNVGKRGEIVEGEAFGVEERGELAVGDAGVDGDGASLGVERDDFVERLQGEESVFAVGDVVEAVAGAEDF